VTAKDRATSKEQKIRIEASSGLNEKEIEKMVKDAESHADEDRRSKEKIEARNQLDTLIYQVEKDTKEWGDKISGDAKSKLDAALERAKKALKQDDLTELNGARDELMQAFSAAGQQFYQALAAQQQQAQPGAEAQEPAAEPAGAGARTGGGQEDVVEADYEIVDDNK
jgi:molecular chaperone DnaK